MNTICIIPARGGSKRILKKNIKDFLGKPAIQYSIDAALSTNLFDEIFVSTDDPEIAQISTRLGAVADILRSQKTSDDYATTADVIYEVLNYKKFSNVEKVCCLYPVSPLVNARDLKKAYDLINSKEYNSVIPITEFGYPPQRSIIKKDEDLISFSDSRYKNTRSQDLEVEYHDAGMFYFLRVDSFRRKKELLIQPSYGIVLNRLKVQDIDTIVDWKLAELKYKLLHDHS